MATRTIRLEVDIAEQTATIADSTTGDLLWFNRGDEVTFQILFLRGRRVYQTAGLNATAEVKSSRNPNVVPYVTEGPTLLTNSVPDVFSWQAETSYHWQFTLSSAETTLISEGTRWLILTIENATTSAQIAALSAQIAIQESGSSALASGSTFTADTFVLTSEKGASLGVAGLDSDGKIPAAQMPIDSDLELRGSWNANTNSPDLTALSPVTGWYYIVTVEGTNSVTGSSEDWKIGDQAVYTGAAWARVPRPPLNATQFFANDAGRAAAVPEFSGQVGIQTDTGSLYISGSTTAGDWDIYGVETTLTTTTATATRTQRKTTPRFPALTRPFSLGDMVEGLPEAGGWSDDDLTDAPSPTSADDYHGFPRVCWIPEKGRILVSYRVADEHGVVESIVRIRYSDDMGANWTDSSLLNDASTDYRTMGLLPLQDGRILGVYTKITGFPGRTYHTCVRYSEDFGETWGSEEVLLTGSDPEVWQTSGLPFQASDGTILIPYYTGPSYGDGDTDADACVLGSTDGGETWSIDEVLKAAGGGGVAYNEVAIFERPDTGALVALIRGQDDTLHRCESSDSGATWGATSDVSPTNYVAGLPIPVLLPNGVLYLLSRWTKSGHPTEATGLWYSLDYGATWETEGVHGAASSLSSLTLLRDDILPDNQYGEGSAAVMADGVVIIVVGCENSGRTDSKVRIRTWLNGVGSIGRQGGGLRLRSGGLIAADALTPPKLDNGAVDALTPTEGQMIYSMAAKCLMVYNGAFWEPQAPAKIPAYTVLVPELALDPEAETTGSLATWNDQGAVGNDFAAAGTTPVVVENALVGRKAVSFGGSGDYSEGAAADWNFLHDDSTDWAMFIPFKTTSADPNSRMMLFATTGAVASSGQIGLIVCLDDRVSVGASGTVIVGIVNNTGGWAKDLRGEEITGVGATGVGNDIWTPQSWHVLGLTYEADGGADPVTGVLSLYIDGELIAADSTGAGTRTALTATATAHIGSANSTAEYFSGQLGRILLYKSLPTAEQINRISAGLLR